MKTKFKFKHSLGQNFIVDEFILDDIVDKSNICDNDFVLEIGAGNGALTRCLCEKAKYVVTVEIDKTLLPLLNSNLSMYQNVTIINDDFLKCDFNIILNKFIEKGFNPKTSHIKVAANLPYYITSPIIMSILLNPYISDMTIMVQKEVAERIVAKPSTKDFGVLTLACNYFAKTTCLFFVSKFCFFPVPKVDSAVVLFNKFLLSNDVENDPSYKKLFSIIKSSFSQRRKKLINSLMNVGGFDKNALLSAFSKLGFDENVRAENLSLDDYKNLTNLL